MGTANLVSEEELAALFRRDEDFETKFRSLGHRDSKNRAILPPRRMSNSREPDLQVGPKRANSIQPGSNNLISKAFEGAGKLVLERQTEYITVCSAMESLSKQLGCSRKKMRESFDLHFILSILAEYIEDDRFERWRDLECELKKLRVENEFLKIINYAIIQNSKYIK